MGTAGEAPSRVRLVDGADGAAQVEVRDPSKVVWLSQTTLLVDETMETVDALRERFPALLDPPSDDICYATQNRQAAVKVIAGQADLVIVVGSPNSSNSVRLVEVAKDYGAPAAHLVDDAGEVDECWLDGVTTIGVTSGASVPEELVAAVLDKLAGHGFGDVEEVEAVEEHMTFALPRELRPVQTPEDPSRLTCRLCRRRPVAPARCHTGAKLRSVSAGSPWASPDRHRANARTGEHEPACSPVAAG